MKKYKIKFPAFLLVLFLILSGCGRIGDPEDLITNANKDFVDFWDPILHPDPDRYMMVVPRWVSDPPSREFAAMYQEWQKHVDEKIFDGYTDPLAMFSQIPLRNSNPQIPLRTSNQLEFTITCVVNDLESGCITEYGVVIPYSIFFRQGVPNFRDIDRIEDEVPIEEYNVVSARVKRVGEAVYLDRDLEPRWFEKFNTFPGDVITIEDANLIYVVNYGSFVPGEFFFEFSDDDVKINQ